MKRALTQSQAAELLRAASMLPPATRDQFIAAVDRSLVGIRRQLRDADVSAAISNVLADTRITTSHFMCDSHQQEVSMRNYEVVDRYGNKVERAGDEQLRDGERLRVPLHMADSKQREVIEHFQHLRAEDAAARSFGHDNGLALHKPGQRFSVDAAGLDAKAQAYADSVVALTTAWQRKPVADADTGFGSHEFHGAQEGDVCTVREGGVAEGSPGHLKMVGGKLTCVPDKRSQDSASVPRMMDAASAQRIRDAAWEESVRADENAWRGPAR